VYLFIFKFNLLSNNFFFLSVIFVVFLKKLYTITKIIPKLNSNPDNPKIKKLKVSKIKSSVKLLRIVVSVYSNIQTISDKNNNCTMLYEFSKKKNNKIQKSILIKFSQFCNIWITL
jgi:hypothetical protein